MRTEFRNAAQILKNEEVRSKFDGLLGSYRFSENPYTMPLSMLHSQIITVVEKFYEQANSQLQNLTKYGYNDHSIDHIQTVVRLASDLYEIQSAQTKNKSKTSVFSSEEKQRIVVIQALLHDIANYLHRKGHAINAIPLIEKLFPQLAENKKMWRAIRRGIELHSVDLATTFSEAGNPDASLHSRLSKLSELSETDLIVGVADEAHIGFDRMARQAITREAIEADKHAQLCLFLKNNNFSVQGSSVIWNLEFSRHFSEENQPELLSEVQDEFWQKQKNGKKYVAKHLPKKFRDAYETQNIPAFDKTIQLHWELFHKNIQNQVLCLFALFPEAESVEICYTDTSLGEKRCSPKTLRFNRESIDSTWSQAQFFVEGLGISRKTQPFRREVGTRNVTFLNTSRLR